MALGHLEGASGGEHQPAYLHGQRQTPSHLLTTTTRPRARGNNIRAVR